MLACVAPGGCLFLKDRGEFPHASNWRVERRPVATCPAHGMFPMVGSSDNSGPFCGWFLHGDVCCRLPCRVCALSATVGRVLQVAGL